MKMPKGKTLSLRLAEVDDAEFIYRLRVDPSYNQHLSVVDGTSDDQREWLRKYKERESRGEEYYFIIFRTSDQFPLGTIRIYDFVGGRKSFGIGSWIVADQKSRFSALESVLLAYDFGFSELGFEACHMDVRKDNEKVVSFHRKSGALLCREDDVNVYFTMTREIFDNFSNRFRPLLTPVVA